jgi:aspartyl-tRNA(Asn)/glutamyl-tRNA(Gln) amidotransferase subunit B
MEEGSFRCDANISVRKKGDIQLGTKVEVKNLNSIRNVKRAIESEAKRLIEILETGGTVKQQTRSFDANTGTTFSIRDKEDADDYRYFAEPDLTPYHIQDEFIERIRKSIPVLQEERIRHYITVLSLSEYDAAVLTEEKEMSDYFDTVIQHTDNYKGAANWMLGPVKSWLNDNNKEPAEFPLPAKQLASVITLIDAGKISFTAAATRVFPAIEEPEKDRNRLHWKKVLFSSLTYLPGTH